MVNCIMTKIQKQQLYAMMPTVDITGQGVALIICKENKKNIEGLKLLANGNANFKIGRRDFEKLIDSKRIALVDNQSDDGKLPNEIFEDFFTRYLLNKKNGL